jgi:hypothetical protein
MPDPGFYAECIEASFEDLKHAALGKPAAREKAKRTRTAAVRKLPAKSVKTPPAEAAS